MKCLACNFLSNPCGIALLQVNKNNVTPIAIALGLGYQDVADYLMNRGMCEYGRLDASCR